MSSGDKNKQLHVIFSGRVQGVGFRYTVCRTAEKFKVTGFVRNLWNGNVELKAEGTQQELNRFLLEIRTSAVGRYITKIDVNWTEATGLFEQFGISYS
jgi:acylphosphatase